MPAIPDKSQVVRFGVFELNLTAGELRKAGMRQKLAGQPLQVPAALLEHPREIVTREELRKRLWPDNTFVDYELALKKAVNRLREVLGDSAENPHYIETLPRRGYRFIGTITQGASTTTDSGEARTAGVAENASAEAQSVSRNELDAGRPRESRVQSRILRYSIVVAGVVLLIAAAFLIYRKAQYPSSPKNRTLTRLTFDDGLQIGATWSPDGRCIAYSSDRGGKFDIWVQQVSGGDPIQITKGPGQNWQPDWSPDGKYIAYRSEEGDGGIYVVPALGGAGLERKIAPFGYYPQWSPDGSQILFQTHFTAPAHWNRLYVAQLDGSAPREVLAVPIEQKKLFPGSAAWHPDGKRITAWVGTSSLSPAFWTAPLAGGPNIKLEIAPAIQRELAQASGDVK